MAVRMNCSPTSFVAPRRLRVPAPMTAASRHPMVARAARGHDLNRSHGVSGRGRACMAREVEGR